MGAYGFDFIPEDWRQRVGDAIDPYEEDSVDPQILVNLQFQWRDHSIEIRDLA